MPYDTPDSKSLIRILYEDNHLLALEKPAGIPSQATPDGRPGMEDMGRAFIEKRDKKPGRAFLHTIHRLDGASSGILLLAKTSKALSRLSEELRSGRVVKRYFAIVEGTPSFSSGEILVDWMCHGDSCATPASQKEGGKRAELKILETTTLYPNNLTLLHIELLSGRYHQIRFQLSQRSYPIVGDTRYRSHRAYQKGKILLHHTYLSFNHPTRQVPIHIHSLPSWQSSLSRTGCEDGIPKIG